MKENIEIKIGTEKDFERLSKLDYTNTYDSMFNILYKDNSISISEIKLPEPIINKSENYTDTMIETWVPRFKEKDFIPLVVFYENNPAGYLMARWEKWSDGKVFVIEGIIVANEYSRKGLAKAMLKETIEIAKKDSKCRGVHVEMDTTKHNANKLLLKTGFKFAGTKFFIYSNEYPSDYTKEAIYFYYPI